MFSVAIKAINNGSKPMVGRTTPIRPNHKIPTTPAKKPLIAKAKLITRLAGTPNIRAIRNCDAAALSAIPRTVFFNNKENISRSDTAQIIVIMFLYGMITPANSIDSVNRSGKGT